MTFTKEDRVAQTILDQIGVPTLMGLGAHRVVRYTDAVQFDAKVIKSGQRAARIVKVTIQLTPDDLYDVKMGRMSTAKRDWGTWYAYESAVGIDAEQMVTMMRKYA